MNEQPPVADLQPSATITVGPNHVAFLEPVVPAVREWLRRRALEFDAGGPAGHTVRPVVSDLFVEVDHRKEFDPIGKRIVRHQIQWFPQGLVPVVAGLLGEMGYAVTVDDRRPDSPRWVRDDARFGRLPKRLRQVVAAVGADRAVRVVAGGDDEVAEVTAAVAQAYPNATVEVAVPTNNLLARVRSRLAGAVGDVLGEYTGKVRRPGRVSVGLIGQLPKGDEGAVDLLVLPYGDQTVGDNALSVALSGRHRRILTFTRTRSIRDEAVNWRLNVVAGAVYPPEREPVPVTAVVLPSHGTRPGKAADPFARKEQLYWHNARRNRRVAEVAKRIALGTAKAVRSVVGDVVDVDEVATAAKAGVAVLVETPVHARALAELLPGWAVWTADDPTAVDPAAGAGVILTELAADDRVICAGVLVRATGTKHPLGVADWPWPGEVQSGVLIDFADEFDPVAARNALARAEHYQEAGMGVYEIRPVTSAALDKNNDTHAEAKRVT